MTDELPDRAARTRTSEDLAWFLDRLADDLVVRPDEWVDPTLEGFLRRYAGHLRGLQPGADAGSPSWRDVAMTLLAARGPR
jgi:hypothetical protein